MANTVYLYGQGGAGWVFIEAHRAPDVPREVSRLQAHRHLGDVLAVDPFDEWATVYPWGPAERPFQVDPHDEIVEAPEIDALHDAARRAGL